MRELTKNNVTVKSHLLYCQVPSPSEKVTQNNITSSWSSPISMREGNKGQCHKFNVKSRLYEGINKEQCHGQVPSPREKVTENNVTNLLQVPSPSEKVTQNNITSSWSSHISMREGNKGQCHKFAVKSHHKKR